ncbi:MAG: hypothetical protein JOS17DRAFT_768842, partial [Linnemannia elongata]
MPGLLFSLQRKSSLLPCFPSPLVSPSPFGLFPWVCLSRFFPPPIVVLLSRSLFFSLLYSFITMELSTQEGGKSMSQSCGSSSDKRNRDQGRHRNQSRPQDLPSPRCLSLSFSYFSHTHSKLLWLFIQATKKHALFIFAQGRKIKKRSGYSSPFVLFPCPIGQSSKKSV